MTELLTLSAVARTYDGPEKVQALADVDLTVHTGELVTVMGPSGSGKSTLLALAGGLEHPTAGTVSLSGRTLADLNPGQLAEVRRREVAFVFQQYNLVPLLTAIENVTLPLELDGWSAERCAEAGRDALAAVGMADAAELYPERLSGGQQQRVAIARAIAGEPRLILADEPTAALDSVAGESIMRLIRSRVDAGAAAIVVTHDARLAALADRVLSLSDGRLQPEASGVSR
ncbi:ABC transporter ATP-binding protein [Salinibacterium sp. dk2585]|uniref:ABC transporter ATP-binding protein n=1 Tax=unclassified Salinibacterium TaxID=2632331 RepID=UPI0011C25152|nr:MULTISPECIES: ABC transporter ATP-binding protein [unclassified Salinibacterium]QEE60765.1 ABC transporter ATP-binding protein [Salinibacterium sp. dk2585]TXK55837.1 ABC transporter ATP-binding protein [Salinibacterium sp. dk5596]